MGDNNGTDRRRSVTMTYSGADGRTVLPLGGKVALVAGATRGAGRAIAIELAAAGATVIATGRSTRSEGPSAMGRAETLDETGELITARGGRAEIARVDHLDAAAVRSLIASVRERHGRLDLLVNDVWGGDRLTEWGTPFWEHDLDNGLALLRTAINTHIITSAAAVPLMLDTGSGLIVEVTDGVDTTYRGNLFYDLAKHSVIRLAVAQAAELADRGISAVAVSPGFLRSEAVLDHFGVTAERWRDAIAVDPHFAASETPHYVGRAIAALAADSDVARFSGRALGTWALSEIYPFTDVDGSRPHWGRYFAEVIDRPSAANDRPRSAEDS